ncbi:hypothetical protein L1987_40571 [Smallanthus sonchifolius]|uniref:Uncharacterized protein n=1 Tax=Smallanthus sonchifolius TaxID=185202 RepID=A0ACB9GVG2_9ASTR|nr:hypothetical protein L1987_40571 [Smallanthus sonchifolius]
MTCRLCTGCNGCSTYYFVYNDSTISYITASPLGVKQQDSCDVTRLLLMPDGNEHNLKVKNPNSAAGSSATAISASASGSSKKEIVNPKVIIHQRFDDKAHYCVEEVQESPSNGCPGLAIPQKGPCLYRCSLELPEFTVMSDVCKRKKDLMQSAAEKALEQWKL